MASTVNWDTESVDIKAAFLQGDELEQDGFIHPPELGNIWKLTPFIYGLCEAPRNWYKRVKHEFINKLGGQISKFDKAYFLWYHEYGTVSGIIALHVDNFIYYGAKEWLLNVVEPLKKVFRISKTANGCFKYLGLNFVQTNDVLYVDQDAYIDELKHVKLKPDQVSQKNELLSKEEIKAVRAIAE